MLADARMDGVALNILSPQARKVAMLTAMRRRAQRWLTQVKSEGAERHLSCRPPKYTNTRLQEEMADWLYEANFNVMVTLTFDSEDGVSHPLATKLFGKFLQRLTPIVLRRGIRNGRVPMAPIIEDSNEQLRELGLPMEGREGTHLHVLMRLRGDDPYKYKDAIAKAWKATNRLCGDPKIYCPDSDQWYLPLTSDELQKTYVGYVVKQQETDTLGLLVKYLHLD